VAAPVPRGWLHMRVDDLVQIADGPFVGRTGKLVMSNGPIAVISIAMGDHELEIEVDAQWVVPLVHRRGPAAGGLYPHQRASAS